MENTGEDVISYKPCGRKRRNAVWYVYVQAQDKALVFCDGISGYTHFADCVWYMALLPIFLNMAVAAPGLG